jgi:acyl-CoA hydrolase
MQKPEQDDISVRSAGGWISCAPPIPRRTGRSIIALQSASRDRTRSRIVARLADGVVTTPRAEADVVVTEYGIAELRGRTLAERARALIAVADPSFRSELVKASERLL